MQKRNNPLTMENEKHDITKRVNPLKLKKDFNVSEVRSDDCFRIDKQLVLKRKFTFMKLSKELVSTVKNLYPDDKTNLVVENALLHYLKENNYDTYVDLVKKFTKGGEVK